MTTKTEKTPALDIAEAWANGEHERRHAIRARACYAEHPQSGCTLWPSLTEREIARNAAIIALSSVHPTLDRLVTALATHHAKNGTPVEVEGPNGWETVSEYTDDLLRHTETWNPWRVRP